MTISPARAMPGRYLSIWIKEVYIWQLYAHFVVMNFVLCWTLQFHTVLVVNKIYVVSNIAVVWTNMTTEYAWNSLKESQTWAFIFGFSMTWLYQLYLLYRALLYKWKFGFRNCASVNSLFIFPQGYTRLKYWSTRHGHVVFLVPNEIQVKARPRHDLLETNVVSLDGQYEGQYDQYEENRRMC